MQKQMTDRRRQKATAVGTILFLLVCEWFFLREMYGSDRLFGDLGDGRLTTLIAEHWYHVFKGETSVGALGMFWPETNTLAYSDMLLGFGIIHSLLRMLGLNIYAAFKVTILIVHAAGTFSCYYLLRKVLSVRNIWSLFGTAAFSFADTGIMGLLHSQLAAAWMLPLFGIFIVRFFQNLEDRKKRNIYALLAVFQIVLVLYTAWYMAFFTALFTCTLGGVLLIILLIRKEAGKQIGRFFRIVKWDLVIYVLFGILLVIPFVLLELPVLKGSGGFSFWDSFVFLPRVSDIVHVTHTNWLLGAVFGNSASMGVRNHEVIRGYSLVLLAVFVAGMVLQARASYTERGNKEKILRKDGTSCMNRRVLCFAIAAAVLLDLILMIRTESGFSLWKWVNKYFPGGKAIRAVGRFMLFLSLPLSLVTAVMADGLKENAISGKRRLSAAVSLCLVGLLLVSNVNTSSPGEWREGEAVARIRQVSRVPEDCEVFYMTHANPKMIRALQQTDAWEIADALGVKTINGYSGQAPTGWEAWWINQDGYLEAVEAWVKEKNLNKVYEYNWEENKWNKSTYCSW